jgi:hypothetical protein
MYLVLLFLTPPNKFAQSTRLEYDFCMGIMQCPVFVGRHSRKFDTAHKKTSSAANKGADDKARRPLTCCNNLELEREASRCKVFWMMLVILAAIAFACPHAAAIPVNVDPAIYLRR